jgi:MFS family permease
VYLNFCLEVFHWSTSVSGTTLVFIGLTIAFVAPYMTERYTQESLYCFGVLLQIVGYFMLSIAGTGLSPIIATIIGCPAVALVACGGFYLSTITALITSQYPKDRQGETTGLLSQLGLVAVIPAYGITVLFSYTQTSAALFYWPGISFGLVK